MNKFILDKLNTNMQRSMRSSDGVLNANMSNADNIDAISLLRAELLKLLYFLILYGDQRTILPNTVNLIEDLQKHISRDRIHSVLCVQELFVTLFGKKNKYYNISIHHDGGNLDHPDMMPIIVNEWATSMFEKFFVDGKAQAKNISFCEMEAGEGRVRASKRIGSASILKNNNKKSASLQTDKIA